MQDSEFVDCFLMAGQQAVNASMELIGSFQRGTHKIEGKLKPFDRSIVTTTDVASEALATDIFQRLLPEVPLLREEGGWQGTNTTSRYIITYDPLDGTRPFLSGASTSTVIAAAYDRQYSRLVAVVIGEPATGRIWWAMASNCYLATSSGVKALCRVWDGAMDSTSVVLIDNFMAFARADGKRPITTNANLCKLFGNLQSRVAIQNYGSNGLHHALVANGNERVAGAITTSMGGEWDCGGALAVLTAGGDAAGFRVEDNRKLSAQDPLDPMSYDILVVANNSESLAVLVNALDQSF